MAEKYGWVRQKKKQLQTSNKDEINIWETLTRPRVTIGSRNAGSEIWHVQSVTFDTRLRTLVHRAPSTPRRPQQKIETLLRVLGDNGIGGERNAGYGMFDFKTQQVDFEMSTPNAGSAFVTLSPICPKSKNQLEALLSGEFAYEPAYIPQDGSIVRGILRLGKR